MKRFMTTRQPALLASFRQIFRRPTFSCNLGGLLAGLLLMWNPGQESDLAGYRVYIGERSGRYDEVHGVGRLTSFSLDKLRPGATYYFAVTAFDLGGNESGFSEEISFRMPGEVAPPSRPGISSEKSLVLNYNYPNPFNADIENTTLRYYLSSGGEVTIRIFDVKGDLIRHVQHRTYKGPGEHTEDLWDGTNSNGDKVAAGLYYCEISNSEQTGVLRIALLRRQ